ncbi:S41 family peptidase [uncultured Pedobacter sp.]|uniref:S41 family peptidase n=1 Tax=uncultured Pedobacter sp. TaxID=246139 RepID=UPI0025F31307|nr:S41 family peptidase [uncultured Pedobacter sp.]
MMRLHKFLLLINLFLSVDAVAKKCDCSQILQQSIKGIENNYALFKIKVNADNFKEYQSFNRLYLIKAQSIDQSDACQKLLNDWVAYFKDKHLWVTVDREVEKIDYIQHRLALKSYRKRWLDHKIAKDSIEGLWEMEGYRAVIIPDLKNYGQFNALIVSADNDTFKPGMLKMHLIKRDGFYDMDFYRRDSTMVSSTIRFTSKYTLLDDDGLSWRKLEPTLPTDRIPTLAEMNRADPYKPTLKWVDENSAIFTLPSCAPRFGPVVDSLINVHKNKLEQCRNLIVDVRGNGGGSDRTYRALLPYLLTKASVQPKVGYYLSNENVKLFRELGILKKLNPSDTSRRGTWATTLETPYLSAAHYAKFPVNVAILMDSKTASSGETFVLKAKTSQRVTTFGTATAGCIDGYNGNVIRLNGASLRYPTSIRTMNLPQEAIDPFGILPDIPISSTVSDPISWILDYFKQTERNP